MSTEPTHAPIDRASERDEALRTLDLAWARREAPYPASDEVLLAGMHKARCTLASMDPMLREASVEWLRAHGFTGWQGEPLPPPGQPPATPLRAGLPPLPHRMRGLPVDERGYPVPYFVAWVDGKPDHRVMDAAKLPGAVRNGLCWMCGQPLGRFKSFCIGPMCSITRSIAEPPSHLDCVTFAAQACPWMTRPRAKRREANMPEAACAPAGDGIRRNPGVVCIWTTLTFKPWRPPGGGVLFRIGNPEHTEWWCEGRPATRAEVDESIASGLHLLREPAEAQDAAQPGAGAMAALEFAIARERAWLDKQQWPQ